MKTPTIIETKKAFPRPEVLQKKWYALYVNSRSEKKVTVRLSESGIENYLPLVKTLRQWSDRKKLVEIPLFSGYVFVKIHDTETETTLGIPHVVNFVKSEGKKAIIREEEITRLKQLIELGYSVELDKTDYHFAEGDKVKITAGPLKNIEGIVIHKKNGRFILILIESLSQVIRVKLPEEILIPGTKSKK